MYVHSRILLLLVPLGVFCSPVRLPAYLAFPPEILVSLPALSAGRVVGSVIVAGGCVLIPVIGVRSLPVLFSPLVALVGLDTSLRPPIGMFMSDDPSVLSLFLNSSWILGYRTFPILSA